MGISLELWRMRVGSFVMPLKCKTRLKTLRLKYVSLSIRILLFFLLLVEGIEANPCPGAGSGDSKGTFSRGRGAEDGLSRGRGAEGGYSPRGRGRGAGRGARRGRGVGIGILRLTYLQIVE